MLNKELISATIPTLNLKDSVFQALELMSEFHVMQLAVVADDKYLGFVSEDDLMNVDENLTLQALRSLIFPRPPCAPIPISWKPVQVVNDHNLSIIPVVRAGKCIRRA